MFPDEETEVAIADSTVVPNFAEWDDHALLVYLAANVYALRVDVAKVRELAGEVAGVAQPIVDKISANPMLKMFLK